MSKVRGYEMKEELAETRKLFTLIDPLTDKKDLMAKITKFHSERIYRNSNLEKELKVVKTECNRILNSVTNLLKQLDTPVSKQSLGWRQEFSQNNGSVENLLQQANRVLEQIIDNSIIESKRINNILKHEREKQTHTKKNVSISSDNSSSLSRDPYHELLRIMKRYSVINATSVSSALYTLRSEGHGRVANAFEKEFRNDKNAMVRFLENKCK